MHTTKVSFFPASRAWRILIVVFIFMSAMAIRLYDVTDLPLDFHPTRQLLSAIKARALYYETQPDGISTEKLETGIYLAKLKAGVEPVVFERLVAYTYRFTGEDVWIARIYSSLFWLIGAVFLFLLMHELVSFEGALLSAVYYLFFPYAVIASRSFQPDPLMVMLILSFCWMFARWIRFPSWIHALLAGLLGGLAIYIKFSAAFFVIGAALGLALSRFTFRDLLRNAQIWLMAIVGTLPALVYLVYGVFVRGTLGGQFAGRFIPELLVSPLNYLQWMTNANLAAGGTFIMLSLLVFFLTTDKHFRTFMAGLWISYIAYGLFFNYHIATHDYYHLPLIAVVAMSLSPFGGWFFARLAESTVHGYQRSAVYVILLFGLFSVVWDVRNQMKAVDFRPQSVTFSEAGELLKDERIIALTQDYGSRLEYWGWKTSFTWPSVADLSYATIRGTGFSFDDLFDEQTSKRDLFLVTDFEELAKQPELEERLSSYPVYARGNGYIIYQLKEP
jgi:hypothetical protein